MLAIDSPAPATAYLDLLNPAQRRAVTHGAGPAPALPLLVIAGAGSGKTNTLAHRVAHLIVSGADPRRILLMTFSRRAAAEMTRRVGRIAREVMGEGAAAVTDALSWAGTFHGLGARLLRDHADQIGLDPAFTIHDREDAADLMNLVRHELGFSKTQARFPAKGTCLSIYSRCVNAQTPIETVLTRSFPWCAAWGAELRELFAAYVEAKQQQNVLDYDDLLLYWAQTMADPALAAPQAAPMLRKAEPAIAPPELPKVVVDLPAGSEYAADIVARAADALALPRLAERERAEILAAYEANGNRPLWIEGRGWSAAGLRLTEPERTTRETP